VLKSNFEEVSNKYYFSNRFSPLPWKLTMSMDDSSSDVHLRISKTITRYSPIEVLPPFCQNILILSRDPVLQSFGIYVAKKLSWPMKMWHFLLIVSIWLFQMWQKVLCWLKNTPEKHPVKGIYRPYFIQI
jgi:hypothetical protein